MLSLIRWKSWVSLQDFFMLSRWQRTNYSAFTVCNLVMPKVNGFLSPSLFQCLLLGSFSVPACFSVSQADDDSSQTPPDYTVRPNIKIHNIGEWLQLLKTNRRQMIINIWLWRNKLDLRFGKVSNYILVLLDCDWEQNYAQVKLVDK